METMKVLGNNILAKPILKEETKSGILITNVQKTELPEFAIVMDKGSECKEELIQIGSKVMFRKYTADECEINGEKLITIPESDILAILE